MTEAMADLVLVNAVAVLFSCVAAAAVLGVIAGFIALIRYVIDG